MHRLIARLWHGIRGPWQWRMLWFAHAKFMIGVTGVVRDPGGRVLLLRHRLRAEVAYEAMYLGGELRLNSLEILEARWFSLDDLPAGVIDGHIALIEGKPEG